MTPITYYGGKQNLVRKILPLVPMKYDKYVEPFFGGGAVFFALPKSKISVINDINESVTNFFECYNLYFDSLNARVQNTFHSEAQHRRAKHILKYPGSFSKVNRAWAFWVRCNLSMYGSINKGFKYSLTEVKRGIAKETATFNSKVRSFDQFRDKLRGVQIFSRDAIELIQKFVRFTDTFIYADPPYYNSDCGHYTGYTENDFIRLLETLSTIKGRFLLSSYDSPVIAEFTARCGWRQQKIEMRKNCGNREDRKIEVLTWNYQEPQQRLFDFREF